MLSLSHVTSPELNFNQWGQVWTRRVSVQKLFDDECWFFGSWSINREGAVWRISENVRCKGQRLRSWLTIYDQNAVSEPHLHPNVAWKKTCWANLIICENVRSKIHRSMSPHNQIWASFSSRDTSAVKWLSMNYVSHNSIEMYQVMSLAHRILLVQWWAFQFHHIIIFVRKCTVSQNDWVRQCSQLWKFQAFRYKFKVFPNIFIFVSSS